MAARMGAARQPAPPAPDAGMPMDAGPGAAGGESPDALAQQLQQVLVEAVTITQKIGPESFVQVAGPIWRGAFAQVDKMIAPMRQAAGQQQAGAPPAGGPPMAPQPANPMVQ